MKKILFSFVLLTVGIALLVWFSITDQGQAGLLLGLDAPKEQLAYGWPAFIGWLGVFSLIGAFALFCFGISQIRRDRRERRNQSESWYVRRVLSYMSPHTTANESPVRGFGQPDNYKPCD